jgi:hypothetical protein
MLALGGL